MTRARVSVCPRRLLSTPIAFQAAPLGTGHEPAVGRIGVPGRRRCDGPRLCRPPDESNHNSNQPIKK
eukprot:7740418-Lingulodinium_polyedra.AAC.1